MLLVDNRVRVKNTIMCKKLYNIQAFPILIIITLYIKKIGGINQKKFVVWTL